MSEPRAEVVEFTDPGCSWAWGSEPKLRRLRWRHGAALRWRRVMGGLVGDMGRYLKVDGFDPVASAPAFARYWASVSATTGMPHPAVLHWMYRSTEPACLAVKAAEAQGEAVAAHVLRALREATFVLGEPPDTPKRIGRALAAVPGLDGDALRTACAGDAARARFRADWEETRAPAAEVRTLEEEGEGAGRAKETEGHWRYVFPTLVVRGPGGVAFVPGWKPYERYVAALAEVAPEALADSRPDPTADEAFAAWGALAATELAFLCGPEARPPAGAVPIDCGGGRYWLGEPAAAARGLAR